MGLTVNSRALGCIVLGLAVATAACDKVQAKTPGPSADPALTVPAPPRPLIIPVPIEPTPTPVPTETPAPPAPARPTSGRGVPPPTPTPVPTPTPTPDATPPVLQTGSSLSELETRAKGRLEQAQKDLQRVTFGSLGTDARDQYNSAASFIRKAQDAMRVKNFIYAHYCADKAATLAGLLVK